MVRGASVTRADASANGSRGAKRGSDKPCMAASSSHGAIAAAMPAGACCFGSNAWPQSPEPRVRTAVSAWQGKPMVGGMTRLPPRAPGVGAAASWSVAAPEAGRGPHDGAGPASWTIPTTSLEELQPGLAAGSGDAAHGGSTSSRALPRCETGVSDVMRQISVPASHDLESMQAPRMQGVTRPMTPPSRCIRSVEKSPTHVVSYSARDVARGLVAGAGKHVGKVVQPYVLPNAAPEAPPGCHSPSRSRPAVQVTAKRVASPLRPRSSVAGPQLVSAMSGVSSPPTCPSPCTAPVQPPRATTCRSMEAHEASNPSTTREAGGQATPAILQVMSQWSSTGALADDESAQDMYCQNEQGTPSKHQSSPGPEQQAPGQLTDEERIRYEDLQFVEHLGSGEFGQVFRGFFRGTEVAIKQLYWDNTVHSEVVIQDLTKEIESFRHLRHKRLVCFVGACLEVPNLCLVTEYCPGGSLHHLLHVRKLQLPPLHCTNMCLQLADGVLYLHSQIPVVVHRDLKSLNVVLDLRLNLKLCDFGLTECMERTHITKKNNGGSPRYMAPELFDSKSKITEKVDIWSTGCIFSEIFGGTLPYDGINTLADLTREMLVNKRTPAIPVHIAEPIQNIIRSCYNFDCRLRPSARQIFEQLRDAKRRLRAQGVM